jgi:hypothetical protein
MEHWLIGSSWRKNNMMSRIPLLPMITVFILAVHGISSPETQGRTCGWFSQVWLQEGNMYVNCAPYMANGASLCVWGETKDDWGGDWDFHGNTGGVWGHITYGHWPWGPNSERSEFPFQIKNDKGVYSSWSYTHDIPSGSWNSAWEIWTHSSQNTSGNNITGDIMVHPISGKYGTFIETVEFDGVKWDVHCQGCPGTNKYEIMHFARQEETDSTGPVWLSYFWNYCVEAGLVSADDWVSGITCGFESFSGAGSFTSTHWDCWFGAQLDTRQPESPRTARKTAPSFFSVSSDIIALNDVSDYRVEIFSLNGRLIWSRTGTGNRIALPGVETGLVRLTSAQGAGTFPYVRLRER